MEKIARQVAGRLVRISVEVGEAPPAPDPGEVRVQADGEAEQRAMAHPEVKRFQEVFSGSQVRVIRNLKQ